jgi:hypothetical protein
MLSSPTHLGNALCLYVFVYQGKRPDQRKAREELRRRAKAVYLALDQQSHDASALGRVDYDEWRQGLRAMRVDTSNVDMALLFANYSDDGVQLDYALWLERLGLGRPETDLLAILKSSLKGLLETEPHAQDNVVAYFESAAKRGHRRPVADLGLGILQPPLPGALAGAGSGVGGAPVVDDFQAAMASLGTGFTRLEADRLRVAMDGRPPALEGASSSSSSAAGGKGATVTFAGPVGRTLSEEVRFPTPFGPLPHPIALYM